MFSYPGSYILASVFFGLPVAHDGSTTSEWHQAGADYTPRQQVKNQTTDIAAKNPQKVKELKDKFIAEAKKYQVLPMDASVAARIVAPRPNITAGRSEFVYTRPMVGLPQGDSPLLLNTSYTITADIEVPQGGAEGMILTSGGRFAGYGFYLLQGKPVFLWNMVDLERIKWEGADALTPGRHTVEFDFKYEGIGAGTLAFNNFSGLGQPGTGTLKVDGKEIDTKRMPKTLPMILQWDEASTSARTL